MQFPQLSSFKEQRYQFCSNCKFRMVDVLLVEERKSIRRYCCISGVATFFGTDDQHRCGVGIFGNHGSKCDDER